MNLYDLHTNPESLYGYKNRWKLPEIAYAMAARNRRVRNPKLERVIVQDPSWAYWYARLILGKPWSDPDIDKPEVEDVIKQNPQWAYQYAAYVINRRWQEAEPYIMRDPAWAYHYANNILRKPWSDPDIDKPEVEDVIMQEPYWAWAYAKNVMNKRWPEAEKYIKQDFDVWGIYKRRFLLRS